MREEYELEVLEQYNIEVKGTRRIRGAFFCDTNEGTMLLNVPLYYMRCSAGSKSVET